jgi:hypothetical protein
MRKKSAPVEAFRTNVWVFAPSVLNEVKARPAHLFGTQIFAALMLLCSIQAPAFGL